jgi:hypothetical protein
MASKREHRLKISAMPWRSGLATAGQQSTIPEIALWEAKNSMSELDGLLGKRPGLKQWGQTFKEPDLGASGAYGFVEQWANTSDWLMDEAAAGTVASAVHKLGSVQFNIGASATVEYVEANHYLTFDGGSTSEWSMRMSVRTPDAPAYDNTTQAKAFYAIGGTEGVAGNQRFAWFDDGIYYKRASDSKYTLIAGTLAAVNGGWHTVEIRVDMGASGIVTVLVDDEEVTGSGFLSALLHVNGSTTSNEAGFGARAVGDSTSIYNAEVGSVMWVNTTTDPFDIVPVEGLNDFRYITPSGSAITALVCKAGPRIYFDDGLNGYWRILTDTLYDKVTFSEYRRSIVITDYSNSVPSRVSLWDGLSDPTILTDAPNLKMTTEHKQRLWGAGDRENPLRLYYSGDRQPNRWFSPSPTNIEDQIDDIEQAGYLEIPSKKGDEITALYGDYYGRILVFTRRGVWQIAGDGPNSFTLAAISQDVGAENHDCVTQVGNDIWFLGRYGIQALSATDQFGDIQSSFPSAPINDLWGQSPSAVRKVSRSLAHLSRLKYNPTQGLVYCAVPTTGEGTPDSVYVFNVNVKQWYGPWSIPSSAMANIEIGHPLVEVMGHGGVAGKVMHTDQSGRRDGNSAYTMTVQSAYLNGRTLDPRLAGMMKSWKVLRLFVLPRGDWDFTVQWRSDNDKAKDPVTVNQNQYKIHVLGNEEGDGTGDFRLSLDPDARLHSREEMAVLEVRLDSRGYALRFTIEQSGAGEDLVIQGFEAEFIPDGYEED